jgi:hypothetical protein
VKTRKINAKATNKSRSLPDDNRKAKAKQRRKQILRLRRRMTTNACGEGMTTKAKAK